MTGIVKHYESLQQAIQFAEQNHRTTGQNLANINTPGYQALEVSFDQFVEKLEKGEPVPDYQVSQVQGLTVRSDGNNVDLERELATMKKNTLAYQTLTQLLGSKMGILKQAING